MAYEFKRLSAVDAVETIGDSAHVLIEDGGVIKKVPGSEVGGAGSWDELTDKPFGDNEDGTVNKISGKYVEGMGYAELVVLLEESTAEAYEHPSFGKAWLVESAPELNVGETYTVVYNDAEYECVCQSAPSGLSSDENAVAMGNFSVVGGSDTGEPFAMLISYAQQRVDIIDLSSATSVKAKIVGNEVHPIDQKFLPSGGGGSTPVWYFDKNSDFGSVYADADKTVEIPYQTVRDTVLAVSPWMKNVDPEYPAYVKPVSVELRDYTVYFVLCYDEGGFEYFTAYDPNVQDG